MACQPPRTYIKAEDPAAKLPDVPTNSQDWNGIRKYLIALGVALKSAGTVQTGTPPAIQGSDPGVPPTGVLPSPTTLVAVDDGPISLSWDSYSDAYTKTLAFYKVYRSIVNNFNSSTIVSVQNSTRFVDSDIVVAATYYYWVTAVSTIGRESAPAGPVTAVFTGFGTLYLADGSVTTPKVATGAITTTLLADLAVTTAKVAALAITSVKLDDLAVTTAKVAALAITTTKISDDSISTPKLQALAVTTAKLDAGAVTAAKITAGTITANEIAANAITTTQLNALAVTTAKIDAGAITAVKLAAGAIDAFLITGATIRTAASGARVIMDSNGLRAYSSGNVLITNIDSSAGSGFISATLIKALAGGVLGIYSDTNTTGFAINDTSVSFDCGGSSIAGYSAVGFGISAAYPFMHGSQTIVEESGGFKIGYLSTLIGIETAGLSITNVQTTESITLVNGAGVYIYVGSSIVASFGTNLALIGSLLIADGHSMSVTGTSTGVYLSNSSNLINLKIGGTTYCTVDNTSHATNTALQIYHNGSLKRVTVDGSNFLKV